MSLDFRPNVDPMHLDREFAADIVDLLGLSEYAWRVTEGVRTWEHQSALYEKHLAGGPLAAPPGHSAHEHGLAVDICRFGAGIESWDYAKDPAWEWLFAACLKHPRLHSGHDFKDDDHIQAVKWQDVKANLIKTSRW